MQKYNSGNCVGGEFEESEFLGNSEKGGLTPAIPNLRINSGSKKKFLSSTKTLANSSIFSPKHSEGNFGLSF